MEIPDFSKSGEIPSALLLHALDSLSQGVVLFDEQRTIIFCNRRYQEIYGFTKEEVAPGTPTSRLIRRRLELGLRVLPNPDQYVIDRTTLPIKDSKAIHEFADGRVIAYSVSPQPGGGGFATHEDITERERLHADVRERSRRFDVALHTMAEGLCMFDAELRVIACNEQYRSLFKLPAEVACVGANLRDIVAYNVSQGRHPGSTVDSVMAERLAIVAKGQPAKLQAKIDGIRTIETVYRPTEGGGWVVTYDDITEREQFEAALAEQNNRFDAALNNMPHGLCMFDALGRLIVCNTRYAEMYGLPASQTKPGTPLAKITEHRVATGQSPTDIENLGTDQLARAGAPQAQYHEVPADGRTLQIDRRPMVGGGWVSIHQDVTAAALAEAQITYLAHHDALTGLPNRVLFRSTLDNELRRVVRGEHIAVLCLDLDQFKSVNDTLGHPTGDELLKHVAQRLRACVRETDTVARLGGDEFAVIQSTGGEPQGAGLLAAHIIEQLSTSYSLTHHQVMIGTSIGIAVAPDDGVSADQLLKNADLALYRAKSDGRGVARFFETAMDAKMQARRSLELDLRKALAAGEFYLCYQPLINLADQKAVAFEALLRWQHPERGMISPADFIPVAEETGLIVPLGAWVLREACAEAMKWPAEIRVSVNLSPVQFRTSALALDIAAALGSTALPPRRLELEITETVMLNDTEATLSTLSAIKALGVSISMDDFGTGYSSLSYLRKFPFDKIKIDQSFVRGLGAGEDSRAIIRAVTGLGRSLGMVTTAEGVETSEQLEALLAEGCTEVQGYYFSPPVAPERIQQLLSEMNSSSKVA